MAETVIAILLKNFNDKKYTEAALNDLCNVLTRQLSTDELSTLKQLLELIDSKMEKKSK